MSRRRHTKKEVEDAIQFAEKHGWVVELRSGHVWAVLKCPQHSRDGCMIKVHSTPQNPGNHANRLRNEVRHCPHRPL